MNDITHRDLCAVIRVLDLFARCNAPDELQIALARATALLPYSAALCALGDTRSHAVTAAVMHGFPLDCLRLYLEEQLQREDTRLAASLELGHAHFHSTLADGAGNPRVSLLERRFGVLGRESACGVFVGPDGTGTYLHLARPLEPPHPRHLKAIDLLMPHLHRAMLRIAPRAAAPAGLPPALTERERAVLRWVVDGKTNWEIAKILRVAEATVKFHLANIFRKLDVVNRGHAVAKALQLGLLSRAA